MSWHCALCGKNCNGYISCFHIQGGIPINFVCHLKCLANAMYMHCSEETEIIKSIYNLENENE